jgi:hypothetical protein
MGFEPTISGGERQRMYALDRADTGTGTYFACYNKPSNNPDDLVAVLSVILEDGR